MGDEGIIDKLIRLAVEALPKLTYTKEKKHPQRALSFLLV
jgi:hypothetical protein